jgi:replicative DNA helicase
VLGSILIDDTVLDLINGVLYSSDFYRDSHRTLFEVMTDLKHRGVPPDFLSLSSELQSRNLIEKVGGLGSISSMMNDLPTSGNAVFYAQKVARTAEYRRLVHAAGEIAALAYSQEEGALETAEQLLYSIRRADVSGGFISMPDLMQEYVQELEYLNEHNGSIIGVTTGYPDLDDPLQGLHKSDLIILAGRPGMGKTSLGLCLAYNAAKEGKKVAVFSLEMGKRQLARRFMSMDSDINMQDLRSGWINWDRVISSAGKLASLPIWINDVPANPVSSIRTQLRRLVREEGVDLVVIDYLQLVEGNEGGKNNSNNRVQEISAISRGLKQIAREFDVPVLALAQLSRQVEQRSSKIPMLSDLKESGSIEENADVVLFLYRDDYYADLEQREKIRPNTADVYIAKHRNGPTGVATLFFKADRTMFYPYTGDTVNENE